VLQLYWLLVLFFPTTALLLYCGLTMAYTRWRPTQATLPLLPAAVPGVDAPPTGVHASVAAFGRLLAVGVGFGLEAAIGRGDQGTSFWLTCGSVAIAYSAVASGLAVAGSRVTGGNHSLLVALARVNTASAPFAIAGLLVVSRATSVMVSSDHVVHHYPWLPGWLAIGCTVALEALLIILLARAQSHNDTWRIERRAILTISGSVFVFLLVSLVPGALGTIDIFHEGESLAGARLGLAEGFFPWRDLLVIHGLLQDQWSPVAGQLIFGDSRWGAEAGRTLLLSPLWFVFLYLFAALMFERRWPIVVASALLVIAGLMPYMDARYMLWPLLLVLMRLALARSSRWLSALLGAAAAGQAVVVPEAAYELVAIGVVIVARDVYRRHGQALLAALSTSFYFIVGVAVVAVSVAAYLATQRALSDFFLYYIVFARGHELSGGLPVNPRTWDAPMTYFAVSPVVAVLLAFWYLAASLVRRRPLDNLDWVICAAGLFPLIYYTKFLGRADMHVLESYGVALPVMGLLIYRGCIRIEGLLRHVRLGRVNPWRFAGQPIAMSLLLLTVVGYWRPVQGALSQAPVHFQPVVTNEPWLDRLGYSAGAFDPATYADLDKILRAYLGPEDWLFDFSNTPGLYYYLLGRNPHTKYYDVSMTVPEVAQKDLIADLERDRPKLVLFTNDRYGLPEWDNIPNPVRHYDVSQYILDHYRPLLSVHGQIFYADRAANLSPTLAQSLHLNEAAVTNDLDFRSLPCNWGAAPNFLSISPPLRDGGVTPLTLPVQSGATSDATVRGWAADVRSGTPAREIVVTSGGRVIMHLPPNTDRPDVARALGNSRLERSGFQFVIPGSTYSAQLRYFGVSASGVASELSYGVATGPRGADSAIALTSLDLGGGSTVTVQKDAVRGWVDDAGALRPLLRITPPPGTIWSDYRWLEIDTNSGFRADTWTVSDSTADQPQREVIFKTLERSQTAFRIYVGSCAQWHGYGSVPLYIGHDQIQDVKRVRLLA